MRKEISRDEAIKVITDHDTWVYRPKLLDCEQGDSQPLIDFIIKPPYDASDDIFIASCVALIWLESKGLTRKQLEAAWLGMIDGNNVFSDSYRRQSWSTIILMMDKASYVAKEMAAEQNK